MSVTKDRTTEYIIVGAGSAGSVLANRLSADHKVTLIEAGSKDHYWDFRLHMPAALSQVLANDHYNWYYESEPEPELNNRKIYCPRGRVLGGSSSINGMVYVRGNPNDFDAWSQQKGLENWSYDHCLPYFKRAEACHHGDTDYRGQDGPMHIGKGSAQNPLFKAWVDAAQQAGYQPSLDFNGANQEGAGFFDNTIKSGRRFSTAQAYLHPILIRPNLEIIDKAQVTRIIVEDNRACGVTYQKGGKSHSIRADCEVILCGGAINSPQLLMLSGIGDADALAQHNIPSICHLPGVGKNLQDHLELYVQYECLQPVSIYPALKWWNQIKIGLQWYLFNTGLGASNHFEAGAFLKSDEQQNFPDLQYHFLPIAMNYDGKEKHKGHGFQVHVGPMKPRSKGCVTLKSSNPLSAPRILFNYNSDVEDQDTMRQAIRNVRNIVSQQAFDSFRGQELKPGVQQTSDSQLDKFIREKSESAYHPSCTCKMGTDEMSVVDASARVHGIKNLRIIDASIMPDITNGNLNAPVIMMAEKLADDILQNVALSPENPSTSLDMAKR
ncbi:MAG: choline dehydrogenase [Candidatus Azotimanducaceae bacterium]|jgi:choline dehydrogenase